MQSKPSQTKKLAIIRATNVPNSDTGKKRSDLYAHAYRQIKKAKAAGFYIECIALCASIIEDRLESRRATLNPEDHSKHRFNTLGTLTKKLISEERPDNESINSLYNDIAYWSAKRDTAIHQMVKYGADESRDEWKVRYKDLKRTVKEGLELARTISQKVETLNKRDRKRKIISVIETDEQRILRHM